MNASHHLQSELTAPQTASAAPGDELMEELRQLRASIALYRKLVDRLLSERVA
jgi:hypothetical protein